MESVVRVLTVRVRTNIIVVWYEVYDLYRL